VSAYLASVDVPLSDLMALEVGDVIPLGVEAGTPVDLYIEDRCCARASWGRHLGMQAVRVSELDTHAGTIDEPEEKIR
jgi:flagellar motor switch protein FliM